MNSVSVIKLCMFLSSYLLLFLSLTILYLDNWFLRVLFLLSVLASFVLLKRIKSVRRRGVNRSSRTVKKVDTRNGDILSYVVTYLVPFTSAYKYEGVNEYLSFVVLLFGIAVLYVKANLLHINPVLSLLGYNVVELTFENDTKRMLITKTHIDEVLTYTQVTFCEFEHHSIVIEV